MEFSVKLLAMIYTYVIFQGSSSRYTHTNISIHMYIQA